jgi:hypothetical protein
MRLRSLVLLVSLAPFPSFAAAQSVTRAATPTTVSGTVHDSISGTNLAGAMVQLVAADNGAAFSTTVVSDTAGHFAFADVPDGRYTIGFFHPLLDSLGVTAPLREVFVAGQQPERVDLSIPGPTRLRSAICRSLSRSDSGAVVVGIVRDWRSGAPVSGAHVAGDWMEISFTPSGIVRSQPRVTATTGDNGWFALCNVPGAGTVAITADRGADSTDRIEMDIPKNRFVRRELYLGPTKTSTIVDTGMHADSLVRARTVHVGEGRLHGTVVAVSSGKPVTGAQVSVAGGPRTRANEKGEWMLVDVPVGTRLLEIRSVGFYPEHRPVDVIVNTPLIRTELFTLKAILDTVRVKADRMRASIDANGFEHRRRSSGSGRFITPADIARRPVLFASDLLKRVPGVEVNPASDKITVRGPFGSCAPALYVNDMYIPAMFGGLETGDIDLLATPKDITGVEIYYDIVPMQFQRAMSGCGAIVIWTR